MRADYTPAERNWIRLSRVEGVGGVTFYTILCEFPDLEVFFADVHGNIEKMSGRIRPSAAQNIKKEGSVVSLDDFLDRLDREGIRAVPLLRDEYPLLLRDIRHPPPVLYVRGSLEGLTDRTIAIVGTRRCTRRGYQLSHDVAAELAAEGVAVISGMARGIDTAAHKGALDAGGVTVAVLGCGVDVVYPRENEKLYHAIRQNGAVVSEFVPGTQPAAQNFPVRNRIISGMSRGVYVVESSDKGGACITVAHALSQGRDVFAAAGGAFAATSGFTNRLCESGCTMAFSAQAILKEYGWGREKEAPQQGSRQLTLDFLEQQIYNLLLTGDMTMEDMAQTLRLPQNELNVAVTMMELNGIVKRLPGPLYGLH